MTLTKWLMDSKLHTCSCGHVEWAHWSNGRCAHCHCVFYDGEPKPTHPTKNEGNDE